MVASKEATSGLTSIRKSPIRRPDRHATPPSSTDSRYCRAGKAGVGLNSSTGVWAGDHRSQSQTWSIYVMLRSVIKPEKSSQMSITHLWPLGVQNRSLHCLFSAEVQFSLLWCSHCQREKRGTHVKDSQMCRSSSDGIKFGSYIYIYIYK